MAKYQVYLPYDSSTVANYIAWAQGISNALSALGWVKTSDTGQVVWGNVVSAPTAPTQIQNTTFAMVGAWTGGTAYTFTKQGVTSGGLTYQCIVSTQSSGSTQALQNGAATLTVTAVAATANSQAIYTVSSGVVAGMIGQQFVVSIGGSNLLGNNAGTFVCVATSGTTSITLSNNAATLQASVTGGS